MQFHMQSTALSDVEKSKAGPVAVPIDQFCEMRTVAELQFRAIHSTVTLLQHSKAQIAKSFLYAPTIDLKNGRV